MEVMELENFIPKHWESESKGGRGAFRNQVLSQLNLLANLNYTFGG